MWLEALSVEDPEQIGTRQGLVNLLPVSSGIDFLSSCPGGGGGGDRQTVYMNNGVERTVNWWPHGELWLVESDELDL